MRRHRTLPGLSRIGTTTAAAGRAGGCLFHAGMNGEAVKLAGNGEDPQYPLLRRGKQQVTPGAPGELTAEHQRCHAPGIDELQPRQVHDDPRLKRRDGPEDNRHVRGVCKIELPAQRDDNMAAAFTRTQAHAEHDSAFL